MNTILSGPAGRNIVLSPHHDDAAFSLGATLAGAGAGLLVNLFTRSAHRASVRAPLLPPAELVATVSAERQAEDEAFTAGLRLERLDLGLDGPELMGLRFRDPGCVGASLAALRAPLSALLTEWVAAGPVTLFCPAGIGGHGNHLATRQVVIEALPELAGRARVLFYEDLPYASRWTARRDGLSDLRSALGGMRLVRRTLRVGDVAGKLGLINLYPSQHRQAPVTLKRFSPAAIWPLGAHEAAWEAITAS